MTKIKEYKNIKKQLGGVFIYVLVFTTVFVTVGAGVLNLIRIINRTAQKEQNLKRAFNIAEAGINYYKWRLAHLPGDSGGAGTYDYKDPLGSDIGKFKLEVTPPSGGSTIITVKSTGTLNNDIATWGQVEAKFGKRAFSDYAFLSNTDAWFGEGEEVSGKMHTNGGIRMDGESDSTIDSSRETYRCYPYHGCTSPYQIKPGVWGSGENPALWRFPPTYQIAPFDFNKISIDLGNMKTLAQDQEKYIGPSGAWGWHIKFNLGGTFSLYKVTQVYAYYGYDNTDGWKIRYLDIRTQAASGTYNIPTSGIIFVEDTAWVSGELDQRVTLAAANLTGTGSDKSIVIHNNITYKEKNGSAVLGLIAQKDVLLPKKAPDKLEIDAALLAQKGHVYYYYFTSNIKSLIELYGTIITNTVWTWSWVSGGDTIVSGYRKTETTYDNYLTFAPPPHFPTRDEYEMISWREIK